MDSEITHFHLFCGLGGGARGFNRGQARVGSMRAAFRCLGGIDSDPAGVRDFHQLVGVQATCMDLFDRGQYSDWHGQEPPPDWREATPADLRRAAGNERPNIIFTSPPCKGFSGLLSAHKSASKRYAALNRLTVRGFWLALEAWADDPPEFFIMENVPRIATRGGDLLGQIEGLLHHYGYVTARTTHDCGKLGGLSQSRNRFLLVARQVERVAPFLYQPPHKPLRSVGETLRQLPMPDDVDAGPMHTLPRLQWKTWVRLAFVQAGGDWRSLSRLTVENGRLKDYLIMPQDYGYRDVMGVNRWGDSMGAVTGRSTATTGKFSVADPRPVWRPDDRTNKFRIVPWDRANRTVVGAQGPADGALSIADPQFAGKGEYGQYGVKRWDESTGTVSGQSLPGGGRYSVADPRPGIARDNGYLTSGHYGVIPWQESCGAVTASGGHDNGRFSVADPRLPGLIDRLKCVIVAEDGTWHRPFTTLELAALQGLVSPEDGLTLDLDGNSHTTWRERIGNAVPPPAGEAIASVMGEALLLSRVGETFTLSAQPFWVRPIAMALSVRQTGDQAG